MTNRARNILILVCVLTVITVIGFQVIRLPSPRRYAQDTPFTERARLTEFSSDGVRVVVSIESDPKGQPLLRATFTPTEGGFHVYSKDLDTKASEGVGMPTRFELLPHPKIKAVGPLFSDVAPERHRGLDIYPDGPVNLRLPIQFLGADTKIAAQVAVSYMACKTDGLCLRPVERQILDVQILSK